MKIQVVEREFVYHGAVLADPNPKFSIEEVRSFYATQIPGADQRRHYRPGERGRTAALQLRAGNWIEGLMRCRTPTNNRS